MNGEDLPEDPATALETLRQRIDVLDRELLELLMRRADVACDISRAKQDLGRPVRDAAREDAAFEQRRLWAKELGLDEGFVERLFEEVLLWSRGLQEREREG